MRKLGTFAAGVAGALLWGALLVGVGPPAHAAGTYSVSKDTITHAGSAPGATVSASANITTEGTFSLAASSDDPGVTPDGDLSFAEGKVTAARSFTLAAGTYTAQAAFGALSGSASASGAGGARAYVTLEVDCASRCPAWAAAGEQLLLTPAVDAVGRPSAVASGVFTLAAPATVVVRAVADAFVNTAADSTNVNNTFLGAHGGSGSATLQGHVDDVAVAPV